LNVLYNKLAIPFLVYEVNVLTASDDELLKINSDMGLGLSIEELKAIKRYYEKLGRNPTDVELQSIAQVWSEHCFHKTFKGIVKLPDGSYVENIFKKYIAKVVEELKPPWCISVFEDNAGIVEFEDGYGIAVKVETHNHPSAIEPFGGAATGVGGVIRDVLGVWAKPIACLDVLCFGPLNTPYEKLPLGVKHSRYLFKGVVAGVGHYGNNVGIPTVCGAIYFDEGYLGNVVVYCGCVGVLPLSCYVKNAKPGDFIVLAGGRTGRDGIHGVTFASAELSEESEKVSRPAVQIPNPIEEEKLIRAIIRVRDEKLGSAITDLGGGGISCAVNETAHRFGCGAVVELSRVPLKDPEMRPWEIWLSESQERMLLIVPGENLERILEIFDEEDVEATPIGRLTEGHFVKVYYHGFLIADLDLDFLFNPPKAVRYAEYSENEVEEIFDAPHDINDVLLRLLSSPNIASKEAVIRTYDHEVKGITALKPLHGFRGGPNDAVVLKPIPSSWKGLVIACGIKPSYGKISPYWMAASCIDEAIRNSVAVGGRRWALLDNFTWGNPERADRMGALLKAAEACYDVAKDFEAPFISGKDSLYNESPLGPVTPTLLITAISIVPDVRKVISVDLKQPGNSLYVLGVTKRELGGSEYLRLLGVNGGKVPRVYVKDAKRLYDKLIAAIDAGCVVACHDVSDGGLAVTLAEMCLASGFGVRVNLSRVLRDDDVNRDDVVLFSESNSRLIVEVKRDRISDFEGIMRGCCFSQVGEVVDDGKLTVMGLKGDVIVKLDVDVLWDVWRSSLKL